MVKPGIDFKNKSKAILFRVSQDNEKEYEIAKKYLPTYTQRTEIGILNTVIGRFSVLPFYKELEKDLENRHCKLINSYLEHRYIANFDYYQDIKDYTFKTYFDLTEIPEGQFVVKGRTNSRKSHWNTKMYCPTRAAAIELATELMQDPLIGDQGVITRHYEPLKLIEEGINGIKFVNEHRIFYYKDQMIASGFYWSQCDSREKAELTKEGIDIANKVAAIISKRVNFFVVDVAQKADGSWIVVEINDGQMSGLSTIDPDSFYFKLMTLELELNIPIHSKNS